MLPIDVRKGLPPIVGEVCVLYVGEDELHNDGNQAIPCRFHGISDFKDGLCRISCGFIDHSGRWFIEPQFLITAHFSEGRAPASLDGDTFGFIDLTGRFLIPAEFQQCGDFSGGLAAVCRDERWGFVDHSGEVKIPLVLEKSRARARVFRHGVAGVQIDGRCGFINNAGKFVVRPEYQDLKSFSEGHAPVRQNEKWGLIDSDGNLVVDCRFDELGELNGGSAFAKADGKAGFVSPTGSWVIQPESDRYYPFFGPLALVRRAGGVYGYIRRNERSYGHLKRALNFSCPTSLGLRNGNLTVPSVHLDLQAINAETGDKEAHVAFRAPESRPS